MNTEVDIPAIEQYGSIYIHHNGHAAYLQGASALVTIGDSKDLFGVPDKTPFEIEVTGTSQPVKLIDWGTRNNFPSELREKVNKSVEISSNLLFNILTTFGDGIKPMMLISDGKERKFVEMDAYEMTILRMIDSEPNEEIKKLLTADLEEFRKSKEEIISFVEENNLTRYFIEQCTDLHWFYNIFPEITSNQETGDKRKIVRICSKEATFSRWTEMDAKGQIPYHLYSAKWGEGTRNKDDVFATPVLHSHNPLGDLRERWKESGNAQSRENRWIVPIMFPTPGRNYNARAYWYSIFESGLYDIAVAVPELRKAILKNQSILNYIIYVSEEYFPEIFRRENITKEKDQLARIKRQYTEWEAMLKGEANAGKSMVVYKKRQLDGKEEKMLEITVVDNKLKASDYINEGEDISNAMAYAMLIHPSIVGSAPGQNKSINGTEARELFIIKQTLVEPFRRLMLYPFYVINGINRWPRKLHWLIPHKELTTLDKSKTGNITNEGGNTK